MKHTLTSAIHPPIVFASPRGNVRPVALEALNTLLATIPGSIRRARLPRGYTITDADPAAPLTLDNSAAWIAEMKRMALTPDYGRLSHHHTGASHLLPGLVRVTESTQYHPIRREMPAAPQPGHARAVWWTCHIPGVSIPPSTLPQDRHAPRLEFPAVSFVALAPAPLTTQDNARARAVLLTEWFRRLVVILAHPDPCDPLTIPAAPTDWPGIDDPTPARLDVDTLMDRRANRFPDGARLVCSYLPHTAPPPPLTLAMVPPLPPTLAHGETVDTDTAPHVIRNIYQADPRAVLFLFPDPTSPRPLSPAYAPRLHYTETAQPLPDTDPAAHVRPADIPSAVAAYAFQLRQLRSNPAPLAVSAPTPTPEDLAEIAAL